MVDHLVSSWESSMGSALAGEPIVALSWLHNGVKLALHVEMVTDPTAAPLTRSRPRGDRWSSHSTPSVSTLHSSL